MNPTVTSDMREERFKNAPQHIQFLYEDETTGGFLRQVFSAYQMPDELYAEFAILIGDVILGLTPRSKLIPLLMVVLDIDHTKAEKIDRSMDQYLKQIETGVIQKEAAAPIIPGADNETREALTLKPRMTEKIIERSVPAPGAKPLTREELLRSLSAKRTLASDMSALGQKETGT